MHVSDYLSVLIREIEQIYRQLALAHWNQRMGGYHKVTNHDSAAQDSAIKSSLSDYIDNVPVARKSNNTVSKLPKFENQPATGLVVADSRHDQNTHTIYPFKAENREAGPNPYRLNKEQVGQLTKYFRENKKGAINRPGIKEKLKKSIWEHMNTSIQCAHRGETDKAKLHADIADAAFKEIVHYMTDEEYTVLNDKVDDRLKTLKSEIKKARMN